MTETSPSVSTDEQVPEDLVLREQHGAVTVLSMNYRPYNLLGPRLLLPLIDAMNAAVEQGSRAIVIRSNLRHFCAGADVTAFNDRIDQASAGQVPVDDSPTSPANVLRAFEGLPIPIVASVHGACLGGGLEVALASDYVIAAASAKLGSVESALGLHPLMGGIQRQVQRIGVARAKEMSMLGRRYDAATLERWGLINQVVPDGNLDAATLAVAQEFANGPTVAHSVTKQIAAIAASDGVEAADRTMAELQTRIWASEDVKVGLESFFENGPGLARFGGR